MKTKILLLLIIFLTIFLRGFQIGKFPRTLYGDEQAFAWNAYNILKTGQDEYGSPFPLQFRSFDDYKAPIPVYLLVPFIAVLDLTPLAIRLPIVIASVLTVFMTYFLAGSFFNKKNSLIITFLLAISPWHVHLSRGYFEATLALLFFVLGVLFFVRSQFKIKLLLISMFFFALTLYSYFTPRILLPLFIPFLLWCGYYFNKNNINRLSLVKKYFISLVFLFLLCLPLLKMTFFDKGFSRFENLYTSRNTVIVETVNRERYASNLPENWKKSFHNKPLLWLREIKNNYLEHLSFNFWYIYGDSSLRYFTGNMGMFYLLEMPFLVIGLYALWKEKRKIAVFFLGWIFLAAIPASLVGRPFAVRSLAILPAPFIFVGYGINKLYTSLRNNWLRKIVSILISVLVVVSMGSLLIRYYFEYPLFAATWWGWENKAAIDYAKEREDQFDRIFISDFYTGSVLAFAVYNKIDPYMYREALAHPVTMADGRTLVQLGKYYFGSLDIDNNRLSAGIIPPKSLYFARPEEADSGQVIKAPDDGRIIFKIYQTK